MFVCWVNIWHKALQENINTGKYHTHYIQISINSTFNTVDNNIKMVEVLHNDFKHMT